VERIVFAKSWQEFFARHNLRTFDDFAAIADHTRTNPRCKRNVTTLTLESEAGPKEFFIKFFYHCHLSDIVLSLVNFGRTCSQSEFEWRNAKLLLSAGIGTYLPVCFGEQKVMAVEKKSFIITEKLKSQCLTEFVSNNWSKLSQTEKEKIIISIARLIRKAHDAGFSLPDLYIWHLFIGKKEDGEYDLAIIDLHRIEHDVKSENKKLRNLGRLDYSLSREFFDDNTRRLLVNSYTGKDWYGNTDKLIDKVKKYSARLLARRNIKTY
jgi:hypothetical protein